LAYLSQITCKLVIKNKSKNENTVVYYEAIAQLQSKLAVQVVSFKQFAITTDETIYCMHVFYD